MLMSYFVECSSMWIFRMIFWWLHWDYLIWGKNIMKMKCPSYHIIWVHDAPWYQVISSSDNNLNPWLSDRFSTVSLLFSFFLPLLQEVKSLSPTQTQVCGVGIKPHLQKNSTYIIKSFRKEAISPCAICCFVSLFFNFLSHLCIIQVFSFLFIFSPF